MLETRIIQYKYNDEEHAAVQAEYTAKQFEVDDLLDEKKAEAKAINDRIKAIKAHQKQLRMNIRNKSEERMVEVEPRANYATGMMEYFATSGKDAGELVDSRKMTPAEKQYEIEVEKGDVLKRVV